MRVFDAARIAVALCEGIRWLILVDVSKKSHGEGIGREAYGAKHIDMAEQLQQLRLIPLAVTAKGPQSALPQIDVLVARTQKLWDDFAATSRDDIADHPAPLLDACEQIVKIAQELVSHSWPFS